MRLPADLIALQLEELRQKFEAGDNLALLKAIGFCLNEQVIPPDWAAAAYRSAMQRWYSLNVKTLDEAFGVQWPKGKHFSAAQRRRNLQYGVHQRVSHLLDEGATIDDDLFEQVGREFYIGKAVAKDYYAGVEKRIKARPSVVVAKLLEPYAKAPGDFAAMKAHSRLTKQIAKKKQK